MCAAIGGMFMTQIVGHILTVTNNNTVLFTLIPAMYFIADLDVLHGPAQDSDRRSLSCLGAGPFRACAFFVPAFLEPVPLSPEG
jgi:hypothetical protein